MPEALAYANTAPLRPSPLGPTGPSPANRTASAKSKPAEGENAGSKAETVSLRPGGAGMRDGKDNKKDEGGGAKKGRKKRGQKGEIFRYYTHVFIDWL